MVPPADKTSLPRAVQTIIDKDEIRTAIYRFARGADRLIRDVVQSVYHEDATDNHGTYNGPAKDFFDSMGSDSIKTAHHQIGQSLIEIEEDGRKAHAETYCTATTIVGVGQEEKWTTFLVRYVDNLEKRDGEWRITHRFCVFDGASEAAIMGYLPKENLGTRDESDYSRCVFKD
ncbi:hypothetical protein HER10_EVM0012926 [Colletotrichum scovillei]|uniref:Nuclear transport factor 2 family protein n=1 Tax=Colletotrichum scovillei TaxID=1209932 RepID=A0A9P7R6K3_9PEZI|nr:uncharacterized protein HER10_EVM0012926 [Colletotrichum scovillei]KAF4782495.1 hypothetical protein HER10_EVM0012926 [Colletotrichum scovillei]KAG7049854.1 nuclear transport factor 2 family protein [Colletotrichum scovillei]KAG7068891.1 nuclear transport factor 2 family protein [Colletotrichum scovillei]